MYRRNRIGKHDTFPWGGGIQSQPHAQNTECTSSKISASHYRERGLASHSNNINDNSIVAIVVAVSMMIATAVVGLFPTQQSFAQTPEAGSLCTPQSITFGDNASYTDNAKDSGIATYVGGDMIIGDPSSKWVTNNPDPTGSYAAEAEGLTLVRGDFWARPSKGFFTMGSVAFGAQYLPADPNATIVAIGGNAMVWRLPDPTSPNKWIYKKAGISQLRDGNTAITAYGAQLGGGNYAIYGSQDKDHPDGIKSLEVYHYDTYQNGLTGKTVQENQPNLQGSKFTVNGTDYATDNPIAQKLGDTLRKLPANGAVTTGSAPAQSNYVRYKYDGTVKANIPLTQGLEKLVTFTGDGKSPLQVFNVKASQLSSTGYNGTDFAFTNIPDGASILINVTDDNGGQATNINYQQGWRFWWNGTEISNGYMLANPKGSKGGAVEGAAAEANRTAVDGSGKTIRDLYTTAASSIMWNYNALNVEIKGAQTPAGGVSGDIDKTEYGNSSWDVFNNAVATDDPSAALLGSVLVQDGKFTSHVTTNGRVWVGGNYAMFNPPSARIKQGDQFVNYGTNNTTSIIDMDQERHSLPWTGATSTSCSVVEWSKTNAAGEKLDGSTWAMYGTYADAQAKNTNVIANFSDNGANDMNPDVGVIRTMNLAPNKDYYIVEIKAPDGYTASNRIFHVTTTATGSDLNLVKEAATVQNSTETYTTGTAAGMQANSGAGASAIVNTPQGGEINWTKIKDGDAQQTPLAGSAWQLSTDAAFPGDAFRTWQVNDYTNAATGITLRSSSGNWDVHGTLHVSATVTPADASQEVNWKITDGSENAAVDTQGTVIALNNGTATLQACSATNPEVCATQTLNVITYVAVDHVTISPTLVTIRQGSTVNYTAKAFDADGNDITNQVTFTWSTTSDKLGITPQSGDSSRATVVGNGITETIVKVSANGKSAGSEIHVVSDLTTIYFRKVAGWGANGELVRVHYGPKNSTQGWQDTAPMQTSACNADYLVVQIEGKFDSTYQYGFQHQVSSDKGFTDWYNNPKSSDKNFTFDGHTVYTVNTENNDVNATSGVPAGCQVATSSTATIAYRQGNSAESNAFVPLDTVLHDYADSGYLDTIYADTNEHILRDVPLDNNNPYTVRTAVDYGTGAVHSIAETTDAIDCTSDGYKCDYNPVVGKFQVKNLTAGTYYLRETSAPEGYQLSSVIYQITLDSDGNTTWKQSTDNGITFMALPTGQSAGIIPDKPTCVTWSKSDEQGKPLAGSVWDIYRQNGDGSYASAPQISGGIKDCTSADGCGSGTYVDQDNRAGVITLRGLVFGTYKIVERTAPKGYWLDCDYDTAAGECGAIHEYEFTLDADNADVALNNNTAIVNKPTEVTWQKIDDTSKELVAGSVWTLTDSETTQSWTVTDYVDGDAACVPSDAVLCDLDPNPGQLKVQGLRTSANYTLQEKQAPQGYDKSDEQYVFVIRDRQDAVTISFSTGVPLVNNRIPNARSVASVNWQKTDFADGHDIEGAEWKLVQYSETDSTRTTPKVTYTISATKGDGAEHYTYSCVADDGSNCAFRATDDEGLEADDPNAGAISFYMTALPWGYYTLTETKAPVGYKKSAREYYFSVDKGVVTWDSSLSGAVGTDNNRLNVTNERYITGMPMTGRFLTPRWIVLAGLGICVLAGSSWAIAYFLRRGGRRERE